MNDRLAHIPLASPETCDRVWSTNFDQWLRNPETKDIFWISGKPGSGKSTLVKYLVTCGQLQHKLETSSKEKRWKIVHFFFDYRAAEGLANTKDGMLRSVLNQVLRETELSEKLRWRNLDLDNLLVTNQLATVFAGVTDTLKSEGQRVLLLVDGLGECGSDLIAMIKTIKSIHVGTAFRICVASRPERVIRALLGNCPEIKVQEHNLGAMQSYAKAMFDMISAETDTSCPLSPQFFRDILRQAQGVFLWLRFATELVVQRMVQGCCESEVRDELLLLPEDLNEMYRRIFNHIPEASRAEVALILHLLDSAQHRINLDLLVSAWMISMRRIKDRDLVPNITSATMFRTRLEGFLGGLIDILDQENNISSGFRTYTEPWSQRTEEHEEYVTAIVPILQTFDTIEVRLSHETVRAYIRRKNLLAQWMKTGSERPPDTIWADIHCDIILAAERRLGANLMHTISSIREETLYTEYLVQVSGPKHDLGMKFFLGRMFASISVSKIKTRDPIPVGTFVKSLMSSVRHFNSTIEHTIPPSENKTIERVKSTLVSPILSLHRYAYPLMDLDRYSRDAEICNCGTYYVWAKAFSAVDHWNTYCGGDFWAYLVLP